MMLLKTLAHPSTHLLSAAQSIPGPLCQFPVAAAPAQHQGSLAWRSGDAATPPRCRAYWREVSTTYWEDLSSVDPSHALLGCSNQGIYLLLESLAESTVRHTVYLALA